MTTLETITLIEQLHELLLSNLEQLSIIDNCKKGLENTSDSMYRLNKPYLERHLLRAEMILSSNQKKINKIWESLK